MPVLQTNGQAGMPVLQKSGARLRSPLRLRAPLVSDNREAGRSFLPQTLQSVRRTGVENKKDDPVKIATLEIAQIEVKKA